MINAKGCRFHAHSAHIDVGISVSSTTTIWGEIAHALYNTLIFVSPPMIHCSKPDQANPCSESTLTAIYLPIKKYFPQDFDLLVLSQTRNAFTT